MTRSITKYDTLFLFEVLVGLILNHCIAHVSVAVILGLVLVGLSFEILTRRYWTYSNEFRASLFTIEGTDVSIAAGVSWAGVLIICVNVSKALLQYVHVPCADLLVSVLVVGLLGNILETVCCTWGMFVYNKSWITNLGFLKKDFYLWRVPFTVRIGYFISFGPLCASIVHWLT
jgi:hypothetical protein